VRVPARLSRASDGVGLWSATYDQPSRDLLRLQESVARVVAAALPTRFDAPLEARALRRTTRDPEAYALYLQGRYFWNRRTPDATRRGVALFERAIARDSQYVLADAGLASAHAAMAVNSQAPPGVAPPKAVAAARKALALDPTLGDAHATLGLLRAFSDWDWAGADAEFGAPSS
jgi:adenylate cyclase